jgi:uncharacterized protein
VADGLSATTDPLAASRMLPTLGPDSEAFWTGGARGELMILRCQACGFWIHPGALVCPRCQSVEIAPDATSGKAEVFSYTVNHHPYNPLVPVPYAIVIVELPEQEALRFTTNVVGCAPDEISIGMTLQVAFEQHDDIFVPVFEPDPGPQ